jgi:hypothetical protein
MIILKAHHFFRDTRVTQKELLVLLLEKMLESNESFLFILFKQRI